MGEVESKAYIVIDPSNSSTFLRESLQQHSSLSYVSLVGVGLLIVITHLYNRIFKNKPWYNTKLRKISGLPGLRLTTNCVTPTLNVLLK